VEHGASRFQEERRAAPECTGRGTEVAQEGDEEDGDPQADGDEEDDASSDEEDHTPIGDQEDDAAFTRTQACCSRVAQHAIAPQWPCALRRRVTEHRYVNRTRRRCVDDESQMAGRVERTMPARSSMIATVVLTLFVSACYGDPTPPGVAVVTNPAAEFSACADSLGLPLYSVEDGYDAYDGAIACLNDVECYDIAAQTFEYYADAPYDYSDPVVTPAYALDPASRAELRDLTDCHYDAYGF